MHISPETAAFLVEGGGFMATRDAENRPTAVEAAVLEVDPDSGLVEIAANVRYARNTLANLRENGRVAMSISRVWGDHRSVQVKGRCLDVSGPVFVPERMGPRTEILAARLESFGVPAKVAEDFRNLRHDPYYLVKARIEDVYDQTPGPGAGNRIP